MNQFVLVEGNPVDGLTFVGPFDDSEEAIEYGEQGGGEFWVAEMGLPEVTEV